MAEIGPQGIGHQLLYALGADGQPAPVSVSDLSGGSMQPTDITATAPATWDPDTQTIGVDSTPVGVSVLQAADAAGARTAIGAGTSSLALGTTASTAAAGNHTHPGLTADQAAGTGSVRTLGTGAQQAAAGNHTHAGLMTGSATAVPDSTATDVAGLVTDFNALLAALRSRGIITGP